MLEITPTADGVRFAVKAVPGASGDQIAGLHGQSVKVRTRRPAERGRANAGICALLAEALGVKRSAVRIVAGHGSPAKIVEVAGVTAAHVAQRLGL